MNIARLLPRLSRPMGGVRGIQSQLSRFSTSAPLSCPPQSSSQPPAANDSASTPSGRFISALAQNKEWANKTAEEHPELFPTLASGQKPEILWIGCSDSRCPETTLLGMLPGDVFVHRNIANIVHGGDINSASVIEFAVRHLKVKHVVLCGHTKCGGAAAAMGNSALGILDTWLLPLRQIREQNLALLKSLPAAEATQKLVELNVQEGVKTLKQKSVILEAIEERGLQVHGVIYDVGTGSIHELDTKESEETIKSRFEAFKTA
ncbi:hypothetical protein ASPWEDRAFT_34041 [Aspergillus wentii DTO 134E9]|uniref:Carbonic anhydrase n=1 Tax=Aspergillus wentii DTO 134E9 TaxID=1073089 RepID=A0A1L9S0B5_ASPWE|nr:uncharacterized protein ASPWEDRAFT_34041 [Aspergillus wentii DTO 134E9]KAI9933027.1 hypothetical protein MW887_009281 [Aspergillus wentii]OJJ40610.1 hypothetical protein ASPWEDRAFT_34041 [Aspergillus wentii DTO 134E9]